MLVYTVALRVVWFIPAREHGSLECIRFVVKCVTFKQLTCVFAFLRASPSLPTAAEREHGQRGSPAVPSRRRAPHSAAAGGGQRPHGVASLLRLRTWPAVPGWHRGAPVPAQRTLIRQVHTRFTQVNCGTTNLTCRICVFSRRRSSSLGSCDDEKEELTSAQLTKRIHVLKKKIHRFEEKFEEDRKYRVGWGNLGVSKWLFVDTAKEYLIWK